MNGSLLGQGETRATTPRASRSIGAIGSRNWGSRCKTEPHDVHGAPRSTRRPLLRALANHPWDIYTPSIRMESCDGEQCRQLRDKGGESEKITINLGYVDLGRIDLLVQEGFYSNRTDFIRTAIRNQLTPHLLQRILAPFLSMS